VASSAAATSTTTRPCSLTCASLIGSMYGTTSGRPGRVPSRRCLHPPEWRAVRGCGRCSPSGPGRRGAGRRPRRRCRGACTVVRAARLGARPRRQRHRRRAVPARRPEISRTGRRAGADGRPAQRPAHGRRNLGQSARPTYLAGAVLTASHRRQASDPATMGNAAILRRQTGASSADYRPSSMGKPSRLSLLECQDHPKP
jgi:hypothetical protein